ncbi:MAG: class I SAM-dependent methyltransferase [Verrucomicrobiae bacterium]|nr:class I SAM-dependent methyltransferase [Verrucomicrobiae bacterium]
MKKNFENWISPSIWKQFQKENTTAHRIFSSEQGWIERWNQDLLISYYKTEFLKQIIPQIKPWTDHLAFSYQRLWSRRLTQQATEKNLSELIQGAPPSNFVTIVKERGVSFQIDFHAGYSLGLFLDQRNNRNFVRQQQPKKLLNCFAYTGSFSVMAALGNGETLSIDLSPKSIQRAKENFRLNQLDPSHHRFWGEDVRDSLLKLQRRKETFDMIILDPPTFSRGKKGKTFQVQHDLKSLLQTALPLLHSPGKILISTNCSRLTRKNLIQLCHTTLAARTFQLYHEPLLPDIPEAMAAQTVWLLLQ